MQFKENEDKTVSNQKFVQLVSKRKHDKRSQNVSNVGAINVPILLLLKQSRKELEVSEVVHNSEVGYSYSRMAILAYWLMGKIIIIIIKICKIDRIWKEYFYHIQNQVNVPGLVTPAILYS